MYSAVPSVFISPGAFLCTRGHVMCVCSLNTGERRQVLFCLIDIANHVALVSLFVGQRVRKVRKGVLPTLAWHGTIGRTLGTLAPRAPLAVSVS